MNTDVLSDAPLIIQIHVAAAGAALVLGPVAIWRRQRDSLHRVAGRLWVLAMAVAAGSSLFIHEARQFGPFSVIHILSVVTLVSLWQGVAAIRRNDVTRHQRMMLALYLWALIVAGTFTFLPGRRMNDLLFADHGVAGFAVVILGGALAFRAVWREQNATPRQKLK